MGRIIKEIEIEGKRGIALFDTGSVHTYIRSCLLLDVPKRTVTRPYKVALGGKEIQVKELCVALGQIEGLEFDAEAVPIDEIGRADGHELDAIIGVLTMEKWEIRLDPKSQELSLDGLRRREFTEFLEKVARATHGRLATRSSRPPMRSCD
jgi:hypothetical protein